MEKNFKNVRFYHDIKFLLNICTSIIDCNIILIIFYFQSFTIINCPFISQMQAFILKQIVILDLQLS
ncbi:unnamed protein product [Blepharisma stoltei]|uniref:Transmembrane protein n=1 Tax=Blepharisma stoltei TaxID=1481888 RepID=A0AAU9K749_9CILI|nr:unnamed protein product [Blepharisma stoltei]